MSVLRCLLQQFLHGETAHGVDSGALWVTRFVAMEEILVDLEHCTVFSQAVHLDPFDALLPAIEGVAHAESFPLGDPVHPAESDGGLVVGPVTLQVYDANLIGLEEHGLVNLVAHCRDGEGLVEGVDALVFHKHAAGTPAAAAKNNDVADAVPLDVCLEDKGCLLPPPRFKLFLMIGLHAVRVVIQHGWHLSLVLLIRGGREQVRKGSL